ncbi:tetratricopeptide repeat protein [Leptolyngbya sp. CCNP1308]|uniref:tetratricopeptide repeat protein n=1 Tax=Leptolyngbya sp. CCNP1308 TaxID=3110255 RepID=UPI002B202C3E|nr:tetratricopeptide repeat protein [Leptolyngbya sp. CCNP1308]MEA5448860.1 tetratricopeptide repeat protein [Leptolyngbya sp. CCNP1308]
MDLVDDVAAENHHQLRRLVWSIQSSYGRLNLLVAICDNWKYRDEIIDTYEAELREKGTRCDRVRIDLRQPSLKQSLQTCVEQEPELATSPAAMVTILGVDELLGLRLNQERSALEQFLFSLQWTRESLRGFQLPLVLWLTPRIAAQLADQAPDFWSWRGGVFEFSQPIAWAFEPERVQSQSQEQAPSSPAADPADLQQQIDDLLAQDPDSPLLGSLYNDLGKALTDKVRYGEAEVAHITALHRREQQLGADHPDVAISLNNLALLYKSMGRYGEAEPLYERSLAIDEQVYGKDHLEVAADLNNLAALYDSMGRYEEAEPLYERSLAIDEQVYGKDHLEVAADLNNLAALYDSMGRYEEAEPLYERSLAIWEQQLGADHLSVATSLNNLATLYKAMGRYREAEPLYERSLAIREQQLGADHPYVAQSLNNLAGLYDSMGCYGEAEPLYLQALAIQAKTLPENHPYNKTGYNNFRSSVHAALEAGQADQLSDHPMTQEILRQLSGLE